mgnify:FL=1
MDYSIIQKYQLEGAHRLDAEYYQPEYLELAKEIGEQKSKNLKDLAIIRSGTTPTDRDDTLAAGVILLKTTDIRNSILPKDGNYYHITPKIAQRMLKTILQSNDILINIVGATLDVIGRVSLVPSDFPESNITQAMALLRVKDTNYLPEYIFSFLMSKYGQFQTDRLARPTGQFNLNLDELGRVLIPQTSLSRQKEIAEIIKDVLKLQQESRTSYRGAENLLLEELGLKDFRVSDDLSWIVNLLEVKKTNRADPEFFQPKYQRIIDKIKKKRRVAEIAKRIKISVKLTSDTEYNYIEISNVNVGNGEIAFSKVLGKELPANAKIALSGGELIISKVRPTRGAIAIIPQEFNDNFIVSGAFSVFNVDYPMREYLQVVFRSIIGKSQLERPTTGTSYPTITDEDIENIWIPDLSIKIQQKIADLVKKSHEARKKSKELLEGAKRNVEGTIEKGGEKNGY